MRMHGLSGRWRAPFLFVACISLASTGCGGGCDDGCDDFGPVNPPPAFATLVPDFALLDVNPNSSTASTFVSPRHYMGRVSAYYFGAAT